MKKWKILTPAIFALFLSACGKDEDNTTSTTETKQTFPLYLGAIAIDDRVQGNPSGLNLADSGFRNRSIASGSPSEVQLTVISMHLSNGVGTPAVPIFLDNVGKVLKIQSGYVDLTDLFQEIKCLADGEIIELEDGQTCECGLNAKREPIQKVKVDPVTGEDYGELRCPSVQPTDSPGVAAAQIDQKGSYTFVNMKIKTKAQMKGCVTGHFMYSVASAADDKVHTYCTQTSKSLYEAEKNSFVNSDFESVNSSKSAELMDVSLDLSSNFATQETIDLTFPISGNFEIDGESTPQITLGIDLGRALRYSGIFTDHPREPQGNMQSTGAHFFPLEPKTNMFTFVGKPGKILGHSWTARVGVVDTEAEVPTNKTCVDNSDGCYKLAGWMTTIFASDGTPLVSNLMPDDDNALTVLKGSNFSPTGYDREVFTKVSEGVYNVSYKLGGNGSRGLAGSITGIDFNKAVGESQTTSFSTSSMTNGKFSFGQVSFDREL